MRFLLVLLFSTAALAGDMIKDAEEAMRQRLRDPDSAKFENLRVVNSFNKDGSPVTLVCGVVNAKNSVGGYAGRTPFAYFDQMFRGKNSPSSERITTLWTMQCSTG